MKYRAKCIAKAYPDADGSWRVIDTNGLSLDGLTFYEAAAILEAELRATYVDGGDFFIVKYEPADES